jgi:hypothetical protein
MGLVVDELGGDMERISNVAQSSSVVPLALAELIGRLSLEEKRALVNLLDWDALRHLREEAVAQARWVGDPRIYVGTTASGLGLELPVECIPLFLSELPFLLSIRRVEILVQNSQRVEEYRCAAADLEDWLARHPQAWQEEAMMIELGPHTLVSGGGGCLSLTLENVSLAIRQKIAQRALQVCGYDHTFKQDHFSAIVWNDHLEVNE